MPAEWAEFAATEFPHVDAGSQFARFRDYWSGIAGAKGRKADWLATWRNWIRRVGDETAVRTPRKTDTSWLTPTGFDSDDEARNFGCQPSTAHLFRDGHRIKESA